MHRKSQLELLKTQAFDLLIIGGGASGAGVALDAAARGLKVALVEKQDFAAGTSSRSTKLVHGGVRYLEQAFLKMDRSQFRLVREALRERKTLLQIAPHLVRWLPLLVPMYRRLEATYYNAGLRVYDWLAGKSLVHRSRFVSPKEALKLSPGLRKAGLKGGVIYYDGQFDDARMNVSLLLTAQSQGAVVANYVSVQSLEKADGKLTGAVVKDELLGGTWTIRAKAILNAAGPFVDSIRKMDDPKAAPILRVSSGSHLVFSAQGHVPKVGILIPKTLDGRVLFVLPWQENLLVGTTDEPAVPTENPKATATDAEFILKEYNRIFDAPLTKKDIRSAWCGLRPLVDGKAGGTARLSRDHHLGKSPSGLVTLCGGKWTTYRAMAEDTVDFLVQNFSFRAKPCTTKTLRLRGGEGAGADLISELQAQQDLPEGVAKHLCQAYGSQAREVAPFLKVPGGDELLAEGFFFTIGEAAYCIAQEMACLSSDILLRRMRLGFLDEKATRQAFPKIQKLLTKTQSWDGTMLEKDKAQFEASLGSLELL